MNSIIRMYHQNRKQFWTIIIIVIFILIMIQLLNTFAKKRDEQGVVVNVTAGEKTYEEESRSIISGGSVNPAKQKVYGTILDEFLQACIEKKPEQAYELLSNDCKEELYPSLQDFINSYYSVNFNGEKTYSFQSWISANKETYLVKIFENGLATGKAKESYIEDYYTIVNEEDETVKLNISNYIGKTTLNAKVEKENMSIEVYQIDIFKDYCRFRIRVINESDKEILLDTRKNTDTVIVTNDKDAKYKSMIFQNEKEDLYIKPQQIKDIRINFNITYTSGLELKDIQFHDIVTDYQAYLKNGLLESERLNIVIDL